MNKLTAWLRETLSDGYHASTSRLIVVICVPAIVLVPLSIWAYKSLQAATMLDFPGSVTGFIVSANTIILGAFHINKREETKVEAIHAAA